MYTIYKYLKNISNQIICEKVKDSVIKSFLKVLSAYFFLIK